jgi:hypothetical protein
VHQPVAGLEKLSDVLQDIFALDEPHFARPELRRKENLVLTGIRATGSYSSLPRMRRSATLTYASAANAQYSVADTAGGGSSKTTGLVAARAR